MTYIAKKARPLATKTRRTIPRIDSRNLGSYKPRDSELIRIKKVNVTINGIYEVSKSGAAGSKNLTT